MKRSLIVGSAVLACLMFALVTGAGKPHSASAGGVIDPSCASSSPCIEYDNNGAGPGIRGVGFAGNGVAGVTKFNSTSSSNGKFAVYGNDVSTSGFYNSGVHGFSARGTGISGLSTNGFGVTGTSTTIGVFGSSSGTNIDDYGVEGIGSNIGVEGLGNIGVHGVSGNVAGQFDGSGVGIIASAFSSTADYPLILRDNNHNDLFFVNGAGAVFYHGSLNSFAVAPKGNVATAYTSKAASPMVEDTGSGQLINGVAMVSLDSAFAQTMDPRTPYHVLLTPDGDTRGLYVERKSLAGFVVREVQGGRSSIAFDYHIYAPARGHAGERMVVMTRAAAAALMPGVPITNRPLPPRRR